MTLFFYLINANKNTYVFILYLWKFNIVNNKFIVLNFKINKRNFTVNGNKEHV